MSSTYTVTLDVGEIEFDFTNEEANVSADIETLTVQQFLDAAREAEATDLGMGFAPIVEASGKEYLDVPNNVRFGITVSLLGDWLIYSEKTSGIFRVLGGNLIHSNGGDIFKANNQITYINIQSAATTIVEIEGGAGFTSADRTVVADIKKLIRADQVHTKTSIQFKQEGEEVVLMEKDVSGSSLDESDELRFTKSE